jgi:hypothetical protein
VGRFFTNMSRSFFGVAASNRLNSSQLSKSVYSRMNASKSSSSASLSHRSGSTRVDGSYWTLRTIDAVPSLPSMSVAVSVTVC